MTRNAGTQTFINTYSWAQTLVYAYSGTHNGHERGYTHRKIRISYKTD